LLKEFLNDVKSQKRIFGLDVIRASAIILVVLGHSRWMTLSFPAPVQALLHGSGIIGVELFFVLSGFLIGGILLKIIEKNNGVLSLKTTSGFWKRRWFRTLPAYYLVLIIYIVVYFHELPSNIIKYFFFTHSFANTPPMFFEESWSLVVEELSYLLSPLILGATFYIFSKYNNKKARVFLGTCIGLILFFTSIRWISCNYFLADNFNWKTDIREVAVLRLDTIYFGFLTAYFHRYYNSFWVKYKTQMLILGLIGMFHTLFIASNLEYSPQSLWHTFYYNYQSFSIALMMPFFASWKNTKYYFFAILITLISLVSYSLYLVHGGLISQLMHRYFDGGINWTIAEASIYYVLYWLVSILLATLIYIFFEKPITDLRERK